LLIIFYFVISIFNCFSSFQKNFQISYDVLLDSCRDRMFVDSAEILHPHEASLTFSACVYDVSYRGSQSQRLDRHHRHGRCVITQYLPACLCICLPACPPLGMFVCLSVYHCPSICFVIVLSLSHHAARRLCTSQCRAVVLEKVGYT